MSTDEHMRRETMANWDDNYAPLMICDHGYEVFSFYADGLEAHKAMWHSPEYPCRPVLAKDA